MFIELLKEVTRLAKVLSDTYELTDPETIGEETVWKLLEPTDSTDSTNLTNPLLLENTLVACQLTSINFEIVSGKIIKNTKREVNPPQDVIVKILKLQYRDPISNWWLTRGICILNPNSDNTSYPYLQKTLTEPITELDLQKAIYKNKLFTYTPELLSTLIGYIYENREKQSEDYYFSDVYIPREDVRFLDSKIYSNNEFYKLIDNLNRFRAKINDKIAIDFKQVNWPYLSYAWPHLLYAYLIENTKVYEILFRVIHEFRNGERLGTPSSHESQMWLLNTEQLFYKDPPSFVTHSVNSYIRPDLRATRRNAYFRMFGMDLNHGSEDGKPYPYEKSAIANKEFVGTFEEFLREVWVGIENANNVSGMNPKDEGKMNDLAIRLQAMLRARRENGNLSREEFFSVSTMSWLHLTLLYDYDIIKDLRANATTPDQRLRIISNRIGMPCHGKAYHFFQLADCVSTILYALEAGHFNGANINLLYSPETDQPKEYAEAIKVLITNWSAATGRDMKAKSTFISRSRG